MIRYIHTLVIIFYGSPVRQLIASDFVILENSGSTSHLILFFPCLFAEAGRNIVWQDWQKCHVCQEAGWVIIFPISPFTENTLRCAITIVIRCRIVSIYTYWLWSFSYKHNFVKWELVIRNGMPYFILKWILRKRLVEWRYCTFELFR